MREQLVGYLMGALDAAEHRQVEEHLERDEALRRDLELLSRGLNPLAADRDTHDPPDGLAMRTCELIWNREALSASESVAPVGAWQFSDFVVAPGIFVAAAMLFFPAMQHSRFQARLAACQNNLRAVGQALAMYSGNNNGYFPHVPGDGNLAVAGIYGPLLVDLGYLNDPRHLVCPQSPLAESGGFEVPSLAVLASSSGSALARLQRVIGGSYGYTFGYLADGVYQGRRNRGRSTFALMSDMPSPTAMHFASPNHGGCGNNVLFEDGHVGFVSDCRSSQCGDNYFVNEAGLVAAGAHADDAVIGPSEARPLQSLELCPAGP